MKRTYETMVLLDNREVKRGWDALKQDVSGLFAKHEAEVVSARRWDERRLAYPIRGQQRGTYLIVYHNTSTEGITGINRELHYAESVLRHMTTVCELVPEEAYQPEAEFDPTAIPTDDAPAESAAPAKEALEKAEKSEEGAKSEEPAAEPEAAAATDEPAAEAPAADAPAAPDTEDKDQ